jgi:hypothetical protein
VNLTKINCKHFVNVTMYSWYIALVTYSEQAYYCLKVFIFNKLYTKFYEIYMNHYENKHLYSPFNLKLEYNQLFKISLHIQSKYSHDVEF